jgi:hypothetical protein
MKTALYLYAVLAGGLLVLAAWLIARIVSNGVDVDMVAFLTVIFMAFRDVISKMGECVRALNGQTVPDAVPE